MGTVEAPELQLLKLPNTGMAVIIDAGMYNDLHPWDKKAVDERLSSGRLIMCVEQNVCRTHL